MHYICRISLAVMLLAIFSNSSHAHMAFKKTLSKKYPDMKINCNACHVKGKKKTERNEFGKLFHKELKEKKLTEGFSKITDRDEKKKYENEVMIPEFTKALEKIKKMKKKDTETTFDALIKSGEMDGITKKQSE